MLKSEVAHQLTTPLNAPAYPWPPYRFRDREYFNIIYRSDPEALPARTPTTTGAWSTATSAEWPST